MMTRNKSTNNQSGRVTRRRDPAARNGRGSPRGDGGREYGWVPQGRHHLSLAIEEDGVDPTADRIYERVSHNGTSGKVYLVGAGPGDPGLITLKALECLKKGDVILYDRLISKKILMQRKPGAVLTYVGKEKGVAADQEKINRLLLAHARNGKIVVRLKGGDPFIFGRGQEEMMFLKQNGIPCETIPGVSSCYAAAEACGIPLTDRHCSSGFLVVTGHEDPGKKTSAIDWRFIAKFQGTIVIMMGLSNLKDISRKLLKNGRDARIPAAVISHGTTKKQRMVIGTLSDIADKAWHLTAPSVVIVGDVVNAAFDLNPKLKPLSKKRFLITASRDLNNEMAGQLRSLGASVDCLPMIRILPQRDTSMLDMIIKDIKIFDWLVFTSRHGVYYFLKRYFAMNKKKQALAGRIACVGSGTASELAKHGIRADLMPEKFTTRDLALTLAARGVRGKRIALLRTSVEQDALKPILYRAGARITDCVVYDVEETSNQRSLTRAVRKNPNGIFFLSPKSAGLFFDSLDKQAKTRLNRGSTFYSIGPVTTKALQRRGIRAIRSPEEHSIAGLVNLCITDIANKPSADSGVGCARSSAASQHQRPRALARGVAMRHVQYLSVVSCHGQVATRRVVP